MIRTICGKDFIVKMSPERCRKIFNHHLYLHNLQVDGQYYKMLRLLQQGGSEQIIQKTIINLLEDRKTQQNVQKYIKISKKTMDELEKEVILFEESVTKRE